jgi:arabinose-5-phosphate isomerase
MTDFKVIARSISALQTVQENWNSSGQIRFVRTIFDGRPVVFMGVGKSSGVAHLASQMFASLGINSRAEIVTDFFHGGMAMLSCKPKPMFMLFSNSGMGIEIVTAAKAVKTAECILAVVTGNPESNLAKMADIIFSYDCPQDGSIHGTIPSASVAAQLGIVNVIVCDIANLIPKPVLAAHHPGGTLYGSRQHD